MKPTAIDVLYALGRPLSPLYGQLMKIRAFLYRRHLLRRYHLEVPVISVGNLTMGGTGKTPLVIYLAQLLMQLGYRPAVISRGYKSRARVPVHVVAGNGEILAERSEAGDEALLVAERVPGVVVITGKKRILPCRKAIDSFGCDVLILDDAFQHLAIDRTLDLVLFDVDHFAGKSRVFPGGELREPISALHRCDAFILTGVTSSNQERFGKCRDLLMSRFGSKPVIALSRSVQQMCSYTFHQGDATRQYGDLAGITVPLLGFCGIARPERFQQSLIDHRLRVASFVTFGDHHRYTVRDLRRLAAQAAQVGAEGFVTTEKDMIKILELQPDTALPFHVPILELAPNDALTDLLAAHLPGITR